METESYNPLHLTLDEVIKLNKLRNKEAESSLSMETVVHDAHQEEEPCHTSIQNTRENSPNGYTTVHDRLGWNTNNNRGKFLAQNQALRAIRNAREFKRPQRVQRMMKNQQGLKLTQGLLQMHNRAVGNFTIRRRNCAGSVYSMSTQRTNNTFYRHSLKKCLDPEIQELIRNMLNDRSPSIIQSGQGNVVCDLHKELKNFKPEVQCTSLPTHARFTNYD